MVKLSLFVFLVISLESFCQNQLVVIKNDGVLMRYKAGDEWVYKRKSMKKPVHAYILSINDSTVITNRDTIATHQIERVYFKQGNLLNIVGGFLVTGGIVIFLVDQANVMLVQGEKPSLDDNVTSISLASIGLGLPMILAKKNSHRVGFKRRLKIIDKNSPFYYSESRFESKGYISPHIPRN